MHTAGDRFEIGDVEGVRIQVSVPAHHVEGVVIENVAVDLAARLDAHFEVAPLVVGFEFARHADVALAVRAVFEQLAVLVAVTPGRLKIVRRLEDQHAMVCAPEFHPPCCADGDIEIIARPEVQFPELAVQRALPFVNEVQFRHTPQWRCPASPHA